MKANYKPSNPSVKCPYCRRIIASRVSSSGNVVFNPHHPSSTTLSKFALCDGSGKPISTVLSEREEVLAKVKAHGGPQAYKHQTGDV